MIPKVIHYVWLSGGEKPPRIQACLDSWRRVMPNYEVVEWDMVHVRAEVPPVQWLEETIGDRVWAFATDYLRLWILYHHGGIYLDSDVRVLKTFDPFLAERGFTGIEWAQAAVNPEVPGSGTGIEAAVIGAEAGHPYIKACLDFYDGRHFCTIKHLMEFALPRVMADVAETMGFVRDHARHQMLDGGFHVYPYDYFATQCAIARDIGVTENSVTLHLCAGSWVPPERLHHPYTYWRLHTIAYWKKIWQDVVLLSIHGRKRREEEIRQKKIKA